jgi:hypothetical protein
MIGRKLISFSRSLLPQKVSREFARVIPKKELNFKAKLHATGEDFKVKESRGVPEDVRLDPKDPNITDNDLALMGLKTQLLPKKYS